MNGSDNNAMLRVGTVLRGIYRIDGYLASGGFGNTYLATNTEFDEQVAIKEFFMKGVSQRNGDSSVSVSNSENVVMFDKLLRTFKREAKRLRKLGNEGAHHIVKVHDLFEENNTSYYVMQYIKGKSLSEMLKSQGKPFDQAWLMNDLLPQMLEALDVIHKNNMWHLDIKPSNIMMDEKGNAFLIDFGSSKQIDTSTGEPVTLSSTLSFTKTYAPFELQSYDYKSIGSWTDFYSLGATLYNLETNQTPPSAFEILNKDFNAFKFGPETRQDFKNLVTWMMKNRKEDRPQSVTEIRNFLSIGAKSKGSVEQNREPVFDEDTVESNVFLQNEVSQETTIIDNPKESNIGDNEDFEDVQEEIVSKNNNKKYLLIVIGTVAVIVLFFVLRGIDFKSAQLVSVEGSQSYTVGGVTFTMVPVQGGTFTMGATVEQGSDASDYEKPAHQVTLSSYYIGQTEVTQELWQAVMGSNPSRYKGAKRPVENVTWNDCQEFINKLNQLTGKNFRLPTEAEWEYAARGGKKIQGYKYSGSNNLDDVAWYYDNSGHQPHDIGTKQPNELGLYDMSGSVWEWCQDVYDDFNSSLQNNPQGPDSGHLNVIRSGSWFRGAEDCRVAARTWNEPGARMKDLGLRLAL